MTRPGSRICASVVAAGLMAAPGTSAGAEARRSFAVDYVVTWLGVPVYETRFAAAVDRDRYRAVMSARSRGIVEMVSRIRVQFEAAGRIAADDFRPQRVRQVYRLKNGANRRVEMRYRPNGTVATAIRPPESPGKRKPVPPALRRHTQDPISALLDAVTTPLSAPPCRHAASVFEGRRRVDTRLSHAGAATTPAVPVAGLPPRAELCLLHAKRVAGFRPRHFRQMPTLPPARLWVVRHPEAGIWLPVQLRLDTKWGPVYARITRFATGAGAGSVR